MKTSIIIPSRFASSRLPEKALVDIFGISLIMRVYKQALKSRLADEVIIATDHERIFQHVLKQGAKVVMTSSEHNSGTDRIAEVARGLDSSIIINVQGDEPLINPEQIDELITLMKLGHVDIGTQCQRIYNNESLFDFNIVKIVKDINDKALYFSRQAIPAQRDLGFSFWLEKSIYYRHIGLYGFKIKTLMEITELAPSEYEKSESLEQLRWLQNGFNIFCKETQHHSIGVDTEEDLERVKKYIFKETFH